MGIGKRENELENLNSYTQSLIKKAIIPKAREKSLLTDFDFRNALKGKDLDKVRVGSTLFR